jgi:glycerophosphoryl diester phosphodiesterase
MTTRDVRGLPPLIAHRGNAAEFPENTLEALQSAVDLGLGHVEFDVQLTADGVPVVLHDADLQRMAGRADCVHDLSWRALADVSIAERARFGDDRFAAVRPATLTAAADWLLRRPAVTAFVEVKRASLRRFGQEPVLAAVAASVAPVLGQCVLISFDLPGVLRLRESTGARIGWVLERFDEESRRLATHAAPDFLFADLDDVPATTAQLWPGAWQWAVYEIRSLEAARRCAALGAHFVETMHVRRMVDVYAGAGAT